MYKKLTFLIFILHILVSVLPKLIRFHDPCFWTHLIRSLQTVSTIEGYMQDSSVIHIKNPDEINWRKKQLEFNEELQYIIFYLFNNIDEIHALMRPHRPLYESEEWIVYNLKEN